MYNFQWYLLIFLLCSSQISLNSQAFQIIRKAESHVQEASTIQYNMWTSPLIFSESSPRRQIFGSTDPEQSSLFDASPTDMFKQIEGYTSNQFLERNVQGREESKFEGRRNNPEDTYSLNYNDLYDQSVWPMLVVKGIQEYGNSRGNNRSTNPSQVVATNPDAQGYGDQNLAQDFKSIILRNPQDFEKLHSERLIKDSKSRNTITSSELKILESSHESQKTSETIDPFGGSEEPKSQADLTKKSKVSKDDDVKTSMSKIRGMIEKENSEIKTSMIKPTPPPMDCSKAKSLHEEQWKLVKGKGKKKLSKNNDDILLDGEAAKLNAQYQAGGTPREALSFDALGSDSIEEKHLHNKPITEVKINGEQSAGPEISSNKLKIAYKSHNYGAENNGVETQLSIQNPSLSSVDQIQFPGNLQGNDVKPQNKFDSQMQQKPRKSKGGKRLKTTSQAKSTVIDMPDDPKKLLESNIPHKGDKKDEIKQKVSYTGLSLSEFFKLVFQEEKKEIGLDVIVDDSAFEYLDSIKCKNMDVFKKVFEKSRNAIWNFDESCLRTSSFNRMYEEYVIVRRWNTYGYGETLSGNIKDVCKILKADQRWPLYEEANEHDWQELLSKLSMIEEDPKQYKKLPWLFADHFHERLATFYLSSTKAYQKSNVLQRALEDGAIKKGVNLPVLVCISDVLELESKEVSWETLPQDEINKKATKLINIMNGEFRLPNGKTLQVFEHTWDSEYTRYYLACPTKFLSKSFNTRLKKLAILANRSGGEAPESKSDKVQDIHNIDITLGEVLISTHISLDIEDLKGLKSVFRLQKIGRGKGRYFGDWNIEVPDDLMSKAIFFKKYFEFFNHKVLGFNRWMEMCKASCKKAGMQRSAALLTLKSVT
ncbi:hypothetical protein DFH28DRAFT_902579 [Melampsora americana]|nr:hypothetical protein DFH28DRAFT_902579 [Melampsora americana]